MSSGINKPFDRILKSFADEAPGLFLRLLNFIPEGVEPDIEPLRPETAPAVILPDFVAIVRTGLERQIIFHAEFQANYHHDVPSHMARYGGSLGWQYQMPVESALVVLRPEGVPEHIPRVGHYNIGATHTTHPYKVVLSWETDPTPVLETHNPRLLPWALLMKTTRSQVREIASIVASQGDDEAVARFLILGSVRYDRDALIEMLGGGSMGFIRAFLDASNLVREEREQAALEGKSEGLAEGRADEARKFLRLLLKKNFPELQSRPEIDEISNVESLESLIERVLDASAADSVREAILAAAAKPN